MVQLIDINSYLRGENTHEKLGKHGLNGNNMNS